jgi:uncharacterized membrane protein
VCGCIFALGAAFFPRLGVLFLWLFTPLVNRAFDTIIVPIVGIIFLPFTTLVYVLVWHPVVGVAGWGWLWVILAFLFDLAAYAGSGFGNRRRLGF